LVSPRRCVETHADGRACGAPPLVGGKRCFWHEPDRSEDAEAARRLGGARRKRERTVAWAYDLAGLGDVASVRRLAEVVMFDSLAQENSVARNRVLLALTVVAARLLEAERVEGLGWEVEDG
jgi:hypothetical protein